MGGCLVSFKGLPITLYTINQTVADLKFAVFIFRVLLNKSVAQLLDTGTPEWVVVW